MPSPTCRWKQTKHSPVEIATVPVRPSYCTSLTIGNCRCHSVVTQQMMSITWHMFHCHTTSSRDIFHSPMLHRMLICRVCFAFAVRSSLTELSRTCPVLQYSTCALTLSWLFLCTRRYTASFHSTWLKIVSSWPTSATGWCLDLCHKKNTNVSRTQDFFRRWTVSLELSACRITWQRYLTCTV